jgi:hypothetical protein
MRLEELPADIRSGLSLFVDACKSSFADDLVSVTLFGSTAEGRHRATSDVNVIIVLKRFEVKRADAVREGYRLAHAAILLNAMFILENEIAGAAESFAVKFADIQARHYVLFGTDPFVALPLHREAVLRRLVQVLANLALRTRERYILLSMREEQLEPLIAEMAAPLRASAAAIMNLEGTPAKSPREALSTFVSRFGQADWHKALENMSRIREGHYFLVGEGTATILALMALTEKMRTHADVLVRGAQQ